MIKLGRDPNERMIKAPKKEEGSTMKTSREMAASSMKELSLAAKQAMTAGECVQAKRDQAALPSFGWTGNPGRACNPLWLPRPPAPSTPIVPMGRPDWVEEEHESEEEDDHDDNDEIDDIMEEMARPTTSKIIGTR